MRVQTTVRNLHKNEQPVPDVPGDYHSNMERYMMDGKIEFHLCGNDLVYCDGECNNCPRWKYDREVRGIARSKLVVAGTGSTHWYECERCHGAVDNGDAYCRHCGARLERS